MGGGFGQKAYLARDEQIVIIASYHLGRPLKWIEDRRENLVAATSSRAERCTVSMAADADGTILGDAVDHLDEVGAYPLAGSAAAMGDDLHGSLPHPEAGVRVAVGLTNTCSRRPTGDRGRSRRTSASRRSTPLARKMGVDPLELPAQRAPPDGCRTRLPLGIPVSTVSPAETLEQAAAMIDYDAFRPNSASSSRGRLLGIGIGLYIEPQSMIGPYSTEPAHIRIQPTGPSTSTSDRDRTGRDWRPRPPSS